MQNGGGNLAADFETVKGYSLIPWIFATTGLILESSPATDKFLRDFRSIISRPIDMKLIDTSEETHRIWLGFGSRAIW